MATLMICDRCKAAISVNAAKHGVRKTTAVRLPDDHAVPIAVVVSVRHEDGELDPPDLCVPCVVAVVTAALGDARWTDLPTPTTSPAAVVPS